ncbi:hypothetical protein NKH77_15785 [Streptomyces sp. M19]
MAWAKGNPPPSPSSSSPPARPGRPARLRRHRPRTAVERDGPGAGVDRRQHPGGRPEGDDDGDGGLGGVWWIIGVGLAAGAGVGFLLSGRGKRQL